MIQIGSIKQCLFVYLNWNSGPKYMECGNISSLLVYKVVGSAGSCSELSHDLVVHAHTCTLISLINVEVGINVEGGIFWKKLVHNSNKRGVEGEKI